MTWSGNTPIPDGDRVEPLPVELRAELDRRPHDPQQHQTDPQADWIVWVAIAICIGVPLIAAFWAAFG